MVPNILLTCLTINLFTTNLKASGSSALFDIAFQGESDGHISHHQHLGTPVQLEVKLQHAIRYDPYTSATHENTTADSSSETNAGLMCYSPNWVTFVPDIIIDAKQGRMWKVELKLDSGICKR